MAVFTSVRFRPVFFFFFFLSVITITSTQNTTSSDFTTAAPDEQNLTLTPTNYSTGFGSTSPTPSSSVEPPVPAEPLPVSGLLPTPQTSADRLCQCNELSAVCDINCCCDRECSEEVSLFTSCSVSSVRSVSEQLCSQNTAQYSVRTRIDGYSELQAASQTETNPDVFCIQSHSVDGLSLSSPVLPTETNFHSLYKQFSSFVFGAVNSDQVTSAEVQNSPGYQYGDVLQTAEPNGLRGQFCLPAPGVTADCVNNSPAAFLRDQSSVCSQRVLLDQDCGSLPALSMDTYTNIQLFSGKNTDAVVVPVEVASVVLQSTGWAQTVSNAENLLPVLLSSAFCANVVLKVVYVIRYSSAGELVNASVSLVLGSVLEAAVMLKQEFQVVFIQAGGEVEVQFSGNPGYVVGLPVVSGRRTTDGITRSIQLRDTLSLLHVSAEDQNCLQGPHQRSPVLFGLDSVSGCTLRLEDITNCSLVSRQLLEALRGPDYPLDVASFGNSSLDSPLDWVQIKSSISPMDAQSCNIPLSRHLEIEWTKYGALVNPQAQIVSIKEIIKTNSSSLVLMSGGSSIVWISSSVTFLPVSAEARPGYRAMPSINAKLPFDFFFPFV
ncbi:tectonic-1 isoform X2 [Austrofundulus limnaeus]|uniref:Tectonic-1 isoform X2 n=1 Tax=Austrofundulus limnaeus TaxID=52670 RepID=A0A2I4CKH4_AUSLI|nr:PREDICTED: tectonic-1-like isoform X2 [Austrofundulus limnaeus]